MHTLTKESIPQNDIIYINKESLEFDDIKTIRNYMRM